MIRFIMLIKVMFIKSVCTIRRTNMPRRMSLRMSFFSFIAILKMLIPTVFVHTCCELQEIYLSLKQSVQSFFLLLILFFKTVGKVSKMLFIKFFQKTHEVMLKAAVLTLKIWLWKFKMKVRIDLFAELLKGHIPVAFDQGVEFFYAHFLLLLLKFVLCGHLTLRTEQEIKSFSGSQKYSRQAFWRSSISWSLFVIKSRSGFTNSA